MPKPGYTSITLKQEIFDKIAANAKRRNVTPAKYLEYIIKNRN